MQNRKDCFYHYNVFEHAFNFEIVFRKSDVGLLVFVILDNNVYFYLIDYYKKIFVTLFF